MSEGQSTSSCGCVWERNEHGDVIVAACPAHLAPRIGEDVVPDIEDRVRQLLDWELDHLVIAANKGKRIEGLRPADPTRGR